MEQEQVVLSKTQYIDGVYQGNKNCFKFLGTKENKPQSFVVGTKEGRINFYKPSNGYLSGGKEIGAGLGNRIVGVELASFGKNFRDRIFYTDTTRIYGTTKKGIMVARLDITNIIHDVTKFVMENMIVYISNRKQIREFQIQEKNAIELYEKMDYSKEKVVDFNILNPVSKKFQIIFLDEEMKIKLHATGFQPQSEYSFKSQPLKIGISNRSDWINKPKFYENCWVSLQECKLNEMVYSKDFFSCKNSLKMQNSKTQIQDFKLFDFTKNGLEEIFVYSQQGCMEYYEYNINKQYVLKWSTQVPNFEIFDLEAGCISDVQYKEFYMSTQDGKIVGYGERLKRSINKPKDLDETPTKKQQKLKNLMEEVDELQQSITNLEISKKDSKAGLKNVHEKNQKQEKKLQLDKINQNQAKKNNFFEEQPEVSKIPKNQDFQENQEIQKDDFEQKVFVPIQKLEDQNSLKQNISYFKLSPYSFHPFLMKTEIFNDEEDGSIQIEVGSENSIDKICVQMISKIRFQVEEPNSQICDFSISGEDSETRQIIFQLKRKDTFLFKFRLYILEEIDLKLKLQILVNEEKNVSQTALLEFKPLFQYILLEKNKKGNFDEPDLNNFILIQSEQLSESLVQFWLNGLFNNLGEIDLEEQKDQEIIFENRFFNTQITIKFENKASLKVSSESISSLRIIKDFIMDNCNSRGLFVKCNWNVNEKILRRNLKNLRNKIREIKHFYDKKELLTAIQEIQENSQNPTENNFLSEEYLTLIQNQHTFSEQASKYPKFKMEYYKQAIQALCQDWFLLKGTFIDKSIQNKIQNLLNEYKYKQIFELMNLNVADD